MTALLNFSAMVKVLVLFACTTTYLKPYFPQEFKKSLAAKDDASFFVRIISIGTVVGERLSPYISLLCVYFAIQAVIGLFI
ncbi:hypothetical protein NEAUS03_1537 [Nematocida ausubeli]|uniref:Protein kish n=1 Tax=Nematocida ausubeli (strain ATCC PRA-371 / ERTm2) TaxID=1913371 RepID=H8ZFQ3_NEMA1|nr:uncharacterized protein NESG_00472 [Nematocida ausubeli]EHY64614.1 hypothetical protein NERG_02424 [Nematocida ausubeli]KAI5137378.1 hypothetical protein NEAUS06_2207 [Nematocida ausubeli]KAI5137940.1 hypothetical protein NEAUS06_2372 [Nematocida ausubeli]KAI5161218.1 hypothetical protein NEAUS03_1537 [Nematocida ausubeli]KFG27394.1 hypothetical protein NESG_00472 [Nematocida ausubeli]